MQLDEQELKKKLHPEQYRILREKGTEPPFSSPLADSKQKGEFACAACGNILFSSHSKFDSKTGWPSFDQAIPGSTKLQEDLSHGTKRTEVICANCSSHLGHVFDDGPSQTTGQRYCINGACLLMQKTNGK